MQSEFENRSFASRKFTCNGPQYNCRTQCILNTICHDTSDHGMAQPNPNPVCTGADVYMSQARFSVYHTSPRLTEPRLRPVCSNN